MIAAGGTGGHVYPALAVAEYLEAVELNLSLTFVGSKGGFERPLVEKSGLTFDAYEEVSAGPIHGVNPLRIVNSSIKLLRGTFQAFGLLRKHRPEVIFSTGGWVSFPVAMASKLRGIPLVIFLPDIEPGLTIKILRRFAARVTVTVEDSQKFFRQGQMVVTGYPLRKEVLDSNREAGIKRFGLDPALKTLLIFGGSRGSRAINIAIGNILGELLEDGFQVIHVTGTLDWERTQEQIGDLKTHPHYHGFDYLDEIGFAFAASDLAVCRSGASVLAEFPIFQLPSILIPLAYSWRYQQVNADYLAERDAAVHLPEERIENELLPTIRSILGDDRRLQMMRDKIKALARPDGAKNVAEVLKQLATSQAAR